MSRKAAPSLNALRVFDVAARCQSFKQAAQQLGVTQAAVTRQIQALEKQLEMTLFHRDNRVHALTPAGLELAPQLESIFKQLDQTLERAKHLSDNNTTTLTVAIATARLRFWLNQQLDDFQSLYPHVQLNFVTCSDVPDAEQTAQLAARLSHDSVDLVIAAATLRDKNISSQTLGEIELVPVSAEAEPARLWQLPWLINKDNVSHQRFLKEHTTELKQTHLVHCDDTLMALELLQSQPRVTLIDKRYTQSPQFPALQIFNEFAQPLKPQLAVFYRKRRQQSVALVAFTQWLQLISK
ncbi:LysR family transcriptional regulator [Idiomarina sp.]|uniref:LysR family transcriptional regulator n=1 Tax=Idiomarina sp. TaxID=1874361 RepID=UPI0025BD3B85|nr:LysR family transcriptional regulator [Idiomarina sp.]